MTWRLATSLETLRGEINALAPNRSTVSDGAVGDPAHASRASRHNPNSAGVVTALDLTHDPANGCDIHAIARRIARNPHPELDYIISNGEVAGRATDWEWLDYGGSNPHTKHAHFGVGVGSDRDPRPPYDSTAPWLKEENPLMALSTEEQIELLEGVREIKGLLTHPLKGLLRSGFDEANATPRAAWRRAAKDDPNDRKGDD